MEKGRYFAIFAWRGDGNYHLRDCISSQIWWRELTATKKCGDFNQSSAMLRVNPNGYVVRSSDYVASNGCLITTNSRVVLA